MEKLYHFYFDEGGMLGPTQATICNRKKSTLDYYFGKVSIDAINSHLQLFHIAFPNCVIFIATSEGIDERKIQIVRHGM